jgi:hypothetical protein
MKFFESPLTGARRVLPSVVLATLIAAGAGASLGASAVAAAECPQHPTLRQLIALENEPGALTTEFPPIFGSYHEGGLACYGSQKLAFRAFVGNPEGLGGTVSFVIKPLWLASQSPFVTPTDNEAGPGLLEGPWFAVAVPSKLANGFAAQTGHWVTMRGHFDDPAAADCVVEGDQSRPDVPSDAQAVEICRSSFVVESVRRVPSLPQTSTAEPATTPGWPGSAWWLVVMATAAAAGVAVSRRLRREG